MAGMNLVATKEFAKPAATQPVNVCILDDDRETVEMLEKTLKQLGFVPFSTSDPGEALEHVSSGRCRVVLCDLKMPLMNGLTFLEHAVQRGPGVFFILMTLGEPWRPIPLEEVRRKHIRQMLEMCGGNRVRAAQMLGIGRTSLYHHLKRESKDHAYSTPR